MTEFEQRTDRVQRLMFEHRLDAIILETAVEQGVLRTL